MNQNIKNFIEEGEKSFDKKWVKLFEEGSWPMIGIELKHFISSRQISLIKMIVREQEERFSNLLDEFFKGTDEVHTRKHILTGILRGINNELTDGK